MKEIEYNCVLINPGEFFLRGKNRKYFYSVFKKHIAFLIKFVHKEKFTLKFDSERFILESVVPFSRMILERLKKIPGVHSIHLVQKTSWDIEEIEQAVLKVPGYDEARTFCVRVKRANKKFSIGSVQFAKDLGHLVLTHHPHLKVKLRGPDLQVGVKIMDSGVFVEAGTEYGVSGLPVGTTGKIVTLLSGGFDSSVASYFMSKRGCDQLFVFFHAYPFVGNEVKEKIIGLVKVLSQYQRLSPLIIVPFGEVQKKLAANCRDSYRTLFFRKAMLQTAVLLAKKVKAKALCTGDSLGQVSSQTLENISLLDEDLGMSVFRPLIGQSKVDIINLSREVGTYDLSASPHDDACSLFSLGSPVVNPSLGYWKYLNESCPIEEDLEQALLKSEMCYFNKEQNLTVVENIDWEGNVWRL